jgi:hypothetical protein
MLQRASTLTDQTALCAHLNYYYLTQCNSESEGWHAGELCYMHAVCIANVCSTQSSSSKVISCAVSYYYCCYTGLLYAVVHLRRSLSERCECCCAFTIIAVHAH